MAKWIGDACATDDDDSEDDSDIPAPATSSHVKWKKSKLEVLFRGLPKRSERIQPAVDQEIELMEALANEEEGVIPQ